MRNAFLVLAASLLLAPSVGAQDYRSEIEVDVIDVDLADLMNDIGRQVGVNILVHPDVQERVTISLRRISWKDAVRVIADRARCKIEVLPGGVVNLKKPRRVSMQYTDANVRTVLMQLADYADANIILGPEVQGTITLDIHDVSYLAAMRAVVETVGGGQFTIVGASKYQVRSSEPAPAAVPTPEPIRSFEGRMVELTPTKLRVRSKAGTLVACYLPEDLKLRARLVKALEPVAPDARLVLSWRMIEGRPVLCDLIAQSR